MPSQGQKTPTTTTRASRARRVVGSRTEEKDLLELVEDEAETGNGLEKGFCKVLWWRKEDIADGCRNKEDWEFLQNEKKGFLIHSDRITTLLIRRPFFLLSIASVVNVRSLTNFIFGHFFLHP